MADRGTYKRYADEHESWVARCYSGELTPHSGQTWRRKGDVLVPGDTLLDAKCKGGPDRDPVQSMSVKLSDLEKVNDEASNLLVDPAIALRMWNPQSVFAYQGWVDLVVRTLDSDSSREPRR